MSCPTQGLVDGQVGTGFRAATARPDALTDVFNMIAEAAIAFCGVAIGGQGEAGIGAGECFCIERPHAVALGGFTLGAAG